MRLLTCAFASRHAFLSSYRDDAADGALDCETRSALEVDQLVVVEVSFPGLPNPILLRGLVVDVQPGHRALVRIHDGDAHGRDFLLRAARGELEAVEPVERNHRRIPVALPITCRIEEVGEPGGEVVGLTHDVGGGGAWILCASPPAVGTRVSLVLGPVEGETFRLDGRVAWLRRDVWATGFGVRFDSKDSRDAARLRGLLRRACETGRVAFGDAA
jgi:hypothetical protein